MSQEVINQLDSYLFGAYPSSTPSLQAYWENVYEQQTDGLASLSDSAISHYRAFARLGLTRAAGSLQGDPSDSSCRYDRGRPEQPGAEKRPVSLFLLRPKVVTRLVWGGVSLAPPFKSALSAVQRCQNVQIQTEFTAF